MDIFTTQLAKIRQTPIKPTSVRIKAPSKESKTKALNEQEDHLSGDVQLHEEINTELAQEQMANQDNEPNLEQKHKTSQSLLYDDIHKENPHHKETLDKDSREDDDQPPHIDVYI